MTPVSDIRLRSILDPIHGLIHIDEVECAVLDHPLFQRLRKTKQNGLLYLVFPSATHTRFEHSLGALHVATTMLDQVGLNSGVARKKKAVSPLSALQVGVAFDFSDVLPSTLAGVTRITRIAALVHDLGHGPFSHTFDYFAPFREDLRSLLRSGAIPFLASCADALVDWQRTDLPGSLGYDRTPHELMSCVMFAKLWHDLLQDENSCVRDTPYANELPLLVAAVILGQPSIAEPICRPEFRPFLPLIHDLIASAPADADRMDYLERDSRSSGVTYGLFDRNRVLKSLLCYPQESARSIHYRLGIKRSGIPALENLVQARFQLFVQIYLHKTNRAISRMLKEIGSEAAREQYYVFDITGDPHASAESLFSTYLDLSDEVFLRRLRGLDSKGPQVPKSVRELAGDLENRKLWKRIFDGTVADAQFVADRLKEAHPDLATDILPDEGKPGATKDLDEGAKLLDRREDGLYSTVGDRAWVEYSILIGALADYEGNIGRIYAKGAALDILTSLKGEARKISRTIPRD